MPSKNRRITFSTWLRIAPKCCESGNPSLKSFPVFFVRVERTQELGVYPVLEPDSFRIDEFETFYFGAGKSVPNHPRLPLFLYRSVLVEPVENPAKAFEEVYGRNRWGGTWRNGIFPYHHYHSTAHEVLGIARGEAHVSFGGPQGNEVTVSKGDLAVLPAGTGHKRLHSSGDLLVVGGYPKGQNADLIRADGEPSQDVLEAIRNVPLPEADPVAGSDGPLMDEWGPG